MSGFPAGNAPVPVAPPPNASSRMRRARPRGGRLATLSVVGAVAVVVALLVGLGYAGLAPWSSAMPGTRTHDAVPSGPVSFFSARTAATLSAAGYLNGGWTPVAAVGLVPRTAIELQWPGPAPYDGAGSSANGSGVILPPSPPATPCWWQPVGSSGWGGLTVPAAPSEAGTGLAPAWLVFFTGPGGSMLLVTDLNGVAAPYASIAGPNCSATFAPGMYQSIASGVIDSTQAAGIANAWGGSAFLANSTFANETMVVEGALSIPYSYYGGPPCGNGSGCPSPVVIVKENFTYPATWTLAYSAASARGSFLGGGWFTANLFASNGTVLSASATTQSYGWSVGPYGGWPGAVYYGGSPPPAVMGGGGGVPPVALPPSVASSSPRP
ncbi:MAG TPA: hypothetical protein VLY85_04395 [Thermoplasmata archaeon]|nr:hypothetical protein [Thermoplasmata archaeon]